MAETQVTIPIGLNESPAQPAQPESGFKNGTYIPPAQRTTLHKTRMGASIVKQVEQESAPQWVDNPRGQGGRFEYRPVERRTETETVSSTPESAQPNDAISQQISQLTSAVTLLAKHTLGIEPDAGPKMPNPAAFDFYDPQDEAEYHKQLQEYTEAAWQQRRLAELEPYRPALTSIQKQHEMETQFNELMAEHGAEPNFKTVMSQALHMVADSNSTLSIAEAYKQADSRDNRPGERGGHLPQALSGRGKRIGQISLRDIVLHNQITGRSGRR